MQPRSGAGSAALGVTIQQVHLTTTDTAHRALYRDVAWSTHAKERRERRNIQRTIVTRLHDGDMHFWRFKLSLLSPHANELRTAAGSRVGYSCGTPLTSPRPHARPGSRTSVLPWSSASAV